MDEKTVRVWTLRKKDHEIRVATIEQNGRQVSSCESCSAPCCKGSLLPVLNEVELKNNKFPVQFVVSPDWLKKQVPRADYLAVLKMNENGCSFLGLDNKCKVFPNCPSSCLSYDCKNDGRMEEIMRTGILSETIELSFPSLRG